MFTLALKIQADENTKLLFADLTAALKANTRALNLNTRQEIRLMAALDELENAVAENTSVDSSAIALIEGLAAKIDALGINDSRLKALSDNLKASSAALAAAVVANTEVDPAPVEPPAEPTA
jgi:uncharacterized membrane protein